MSNTDFVRRFGGIYEDSPWVAECAAAHLGRAADYDQIAGLMQDCVDNASRDLQLALIRAHPDLADRARVAAGLSDASRAEQAGAGLDRCTPDEFERFQRLNAAYRAKFGFPFVIAVRKLGRTEILAAFERRIGNDRETEFETALAEIHRIARSRLEALGLAGTSGGMP
ncbi:MAG TPA: 2-oxo-4-hydroxy-4-carboxy-5-ureidoimidazoline decarboxylase [Woeseiaceae bacterium]|nr:2-oxo-4-hydroxy-4-carboxy-5-ureidoimidazoline decarboxylase [Woeseiaceae bacterium]